MYAHAFHLWGRIIVPLAWLQHGVVDGDVGVNEVCAQERVDILRGELAEARTILRPVRVVADPLVLKF